MSKYPFYGSRQMVRQLRREGLCIGRHRVRRLMRLMGLQAIYQAPRTSDPHPEHRHLLSLVIDRPNQVWCPTSPTSVQRGFRTWLRSWTGQPAMFWHGGCRTTMDLLLRRGLERALSKYAKSSIPIREASSPGLHRRSQGCEITISSGAGAWTNAWANTRPST